MTLNQKRADIMTSIKIWLMGLAFIMFFIVILFFILVFMLSKGLS